MSLTSSMFTSVREAVIGHNSGQLSSHASNVAQTFCRHRGSCRDCNRVLDAPF